MIDGIVNKLLSMYMEYETERINKKFRKKEKGIIPSFVTKRRITIYNNGVKVFDSNGEKEIPENIQYTIRSYGIPKNVKPNSKTPIVYKINTTLTPFFSSEAVEEECLSSENKIQAMKVRSH